MPVEIFSVEQLLDGLQRSAPMMYVRSGGKRFTLSPNVLTAKPCPICMRMIQNAGIKRIVATDAEIDIVELAIPPIPEL